MSLKDFQFIGKLGEGAYSSVYKVKRLIDNQIYAIKKVKMNNLTQRQKQNALNQVRILASINHPNIIAYKQAFIDKSTNFLYVIMQFADQGDLYAKITNHVKNNTKFTEKQIWSIFIQITKGLKSLHDLRILHRDLKSANVFMFSDGTVKLGDMNVSKLSKSMCKTQTGTPYYASPQVWKDQTYDKKSDIWSLGCVLYESIALKPPFRANDMQQLFKKVTRGFYPRISPQYSDQLNNILKILLQVTPHLRPTCDKILQLSVILKHSQSLPRHLKQSQSQKKLNAKNQLLSTIKINHDSKDNIDLQMPRPRYISNLDSSSTPNLLPAMSQVLAEKIQKPDVIKGILPQIHNHGEKKAPKNDVSIVKWNEKSQIVKKLTQQSNFNKISKSLHAVQNKKYVNYQSLDVNLENLNHRLLKKNTLIPKNIERNLQINGGQQKLPLIYKGRLKSISPQTLKKIINRQKQKKRIYSIIDKKF